jgi:hypothetical protein
MRVKKTQTKRKSNLPPGPGPGRPKGSKNRTYPFLDDVFDIYIEFGGKDGLRDRIKASRRNADKFDAAIIEMAQKQLPDKIEYSGVTRVVVEWPNGDHV